MLCEKPFTANAAEAREVAAAADGTGLVVMEAFHYRYHPLARRMARDRPRRRAGRGSSAIETAMCFPLPRFADIRYNFDLAGGALMDAGCYAVHCLRLLAPGEPAVTGARALTLQPRPARRPGDDRRLPFPGGATGPHPHVDVVRRRCCASGPA